jgi:hypothetical protein
MKGKALLMLFIFLLNTVVGFSCALHMSHKDHNENGEQHKHHHHNSSLILNQQKNSNSSAAYIDKDDPCCQGAVNNFVNLAKLVPQSEKVIIQAPIVYIGFYYQFSLVNPPGVLTRNQISFDKRQRPPTPNIRTVIQSFQI